MLIGIDVAHTGPGGDHSVAGFCATTNTTFSKYYSKVTFQRTGQELIDKLKDCMKDAIVQYFKNNHALPETIIVYRDGVGDGQLSAVVRMVMAVIAVMAVMV